MAEQTLACETPAATPFNAPRSLSLRARLLLRFYRGVVKALLDKPVDLAAGRKFMAMMDRWLGRGAAGFSRERIDANGVEADWITVDASGSKVPTRVILYLHGGGFMFDSPRLHARLAARLCRTLDARALMPEYRLAPEHPLPAAHEDCLAAYRWLLADGHDPARIVVIGDSAGGLLVLATLQRIRDAGLPLPACGVMFSPGTCFDSIRQLGARDTAGDPMIGAGVLDLLQRVVVAAVAPNDGAVSPCAGGMHGLPPLLFQAGSTELLLPQSEKAVALARAAGTHAELQVWPELPHVWQAVHWLPEAQQALACVGDFVARHGSTLAQSGKVGAGDTALSTVEKSMTTPETSSGLELRSLVKAGGELELSLIAVPVAEPAADEVIIRVEATPINPSDLGLLFGAADMATARASGTPDAPVVTATIPERAMNSMKGRLDQSMTVGNEGAGTVVAAGSSREAQDLLGKTVATFGGGMYVQYRRAKAAQCVVLPADCSAADGASIFVNPLTAVSMVDVMRKEGHSALVNTAAASTLGQMLNRLCIMDGIGLVNIVRSEAQADVLRSIGAVHICNSSAPGFTDDLTQALSATGATLAFDAIGGGELAGQILSCMEKAIISQAAKGYSRYGSATHKQVYIYGVLDPGPTILKRNCGPAFGVGGWLLTNYLQKVGAGETAKFQTRVLAELKTTFASSYTREISLAEALHLDHIEGYSQRATAGKYLINPARTLATDTLR